MGGRVDTLFYLVFVGLSRSNTRLQCDRNTLPDARPLKLVDLIFTAPDAAISGEVEIEKYVQLLAENTCVYINVYST